MNIQDICWAIREIELKKPFITALRTLTHLRVVEVTIADQEGFQGLGGRAPTAAITGETESSIFGALECMRERLTASGGGGLNALTRETSLALKGNTSAKSAVGMAWMRVRYDVDRLRLSEAPGLGMVE